MIVAFRLGRIFRIKTAQSCHSDRDCCGKWPLAKPFFRPRAAVVAISFGEDKLDRSGLESQAVWCGLTVLGLGVSASARWRRDRGAAAASA